MKLSKYKLFKQLYKTFFNISWNIYDFVDKAPKRLHNLGKRKLVNSRISFKSRPYTKDRTKDFYINNERVKTY